MPTRKDKNWQKESAATAYVAPDCRYPFGRSDAGPLTNPIAERQPLKVQESRIMEVRIKTLKAASGKVARQNPEGNGGNALERVSFLSFINQNSSGFLLGRQLFTT